MAVDFIRLQPLISSLTHSLAFTSQLYSILWKLSKTLNTKIVTYAFYDVEFYQWPSTRAAMWPIAQNAIAIGSIPLTDQKEDKRTKNTFTTHRSTVSAQINHRNLCSQPTEVSRNRWIASTILQNAWVNRMKLCALRRQLKIFERNNCERITWIICNAVKERQWHRNLVAERDSLASLAVIVGGKMNRNSSTTCSAARCLCRCAFFTRQQSKTQFRKRQQHTFFR